MADDHSDRDRDDRDDRRDREDRVDRSLTRRDFLRGAGAGAAGLALTGIPGRAEAGAPRILSAGSGRSASGSRNGRPNLVVIMADQLGRNHCGFAGDEKAHTPNMDRIAREGADFVNGMVVYPMCAPFRASFFSGRYPSSTGMVINELRVMPNPRSLASVLMENGYRTCYIGKWHLFGKDHTIPQQFCPPGPYRLGFDGQWNAFNFHHDYYDGFYFRDTFDPIDVDGYEPHHQTEMAVDYLRSREGSEEPFALFLSMGPPHDPWTWDNCPETFNQMYREVEFPDPPNFQADGHALYWSRDRGREWYEQQFLPNRFRYRKVYHAMTASVDWNVGRVLEELDRLGMAEDTLLMFTSDHGEMFGAHGRVAKKIYYDEAARVPLLLRWPGEIPAGRQSEVPINSPDLMPTLLSLLDLPIPDRVEGADLSHSARGEPGPEPDYALLQGMGHTFQWVDGWEWRALRGRRYTYALERSPRRELLFDNARDPYQMENLADDPEHSELTARLRRRLQQRMDELNDRFEKTTWYRDHWTRDRVILRSATRELEPRFRPENIDLPHIPST